MAKVKLLVDTDIIIDYLKGVKPARDLFRSGDVDIYCSVLSKKELLSAVGLSDSERKKIVGLLSKIKVLKIDKDINKKYSFLIDKYGERQESVMQHNKGEHQLPVSLLHCCIARPDPYPTILQCYEVPFKVPDAEFLGTHESRPKHRSDQA